MKINLEDIPDEVFWATAIINNGQPVSEKVYNEVNEVINKYPQYFAWEHKYRQIPQEVHDAFSKECYPEWFKSTEETESNGILHQIESSDYTTLGGSLTEDDFKRFIIQMETDFELERKLIEREERIWDKHYKKYGLKYRKYSGI